MNTRKVLEKNIYRYYTDFIYSLSFMQWSTLHCLLCFINDVFFCLFCVLWMSFPIKIPMWIWFILMFSTSPQNLQLKFWDILYVQSTLNYITYLFLDVSNKSLLKYRLMSSSISRASTEAQIKLLKKTA